MRWPWLPLSTLSGHAQLPASGSDEALLCRLGGGGGTARLGVRRRWSPALQIQNFFPLSSPSHRVFLTILRLLRLVRLELEPNRTNRNRNCSVLDPRKNRSVPIFEEPNFSENRRTEPIGSVRTECPAQPPPLSPT